MWSLDLADADVLQAGRLGEPLSELGLDARSVVVTALVRATRSGGRLRV